MSLSAGVACADSFLQALRHERARMSETVFMVVLIGLFLFTLALFILLVELDRL